MTLKNDMIQSITSNEKKRRISLTLKGAGTIIDLAGNSFSYKIAKNPMEADRKAIARAWQSVGNDIRQAMIKFPIKKTSKDV